jgi:Ran GTPase-activating protein (RanGAP) involved in mRNA processing and transport
MAALLDPGRASVNVTLDPDLLTRLAACIGAGQTLTTYSEIDLASRGLTAADIAEGGASDLTHTLRSLQSEGTSAAHASQLQPCSRVLISLKLRDNPALGDAGAGVIGAALASVPSELHSLSLASTGLSDAGVLALINALVHSARSMSEAVGMSISRLDLSLNSMGARAASALSSLLRSPGTRLRDLCLRDNSLGDAGVVILADGLAANHSLQKLDLGGNAVGAAGVFAVARALTSQRVLTSLSLADNCLTGEEGGAAVQAVLESGVSLSLLCLGGNCFNSAEAVAQMVMAGQAASDRAAHPYSAEAGFHSHHGHRLQGEHPVPQDHGLPHSSPYADQAGWPLRPFPGTSSPYAFRHGSHGDRTPGDALGSLALGEVSAVSLSYHQPASRGLTSLFLERSHIGGGPLAASLLSAFGPVLEHLRLGNNHLDDAAAAALACILVDGRAPRLRRLWLDHNRITGSGARALVHASLSAQGLAQLRLEGNPIEPRVAEELRALCGKRPAAGVGVG